MKSIFKKNIDDLWQMTIESWVKMNPEYPNVLKLIDITEFKDKNKELSVFLEKYQEIDTKNTQVLTLLGVLSFFDLNFQNAATHFKKAVLLENLNYDFWNKLGACYANASNNEKALIWYETALKIRPNLPRAWGNLGISYYNKGNYVEAVKNFLNALSLSPLADHLWRQIYQWFHILEDQNNGEKALSKDFDYFKNLYNVLDLENLPLPNTEGIEDAVNTIKE